MSALIPYGPWLLPLAAFWAPILAFLLLKVTAEPLDGPDKQPTHPVNTVPLTAGHREHEPPGALL